MPNTVSVHITPEQLIWLVKHPVILLTIRADGVHKVRTICQTKFEVEQIGDLSLLFDTYRKNRNTVVERLEQIRMLHNATSNIKLNMVETIEQLRKMMQIENEAVESNKENWIPKAVYTIDVLKVGIKNLLTFLSEDVKTIYPNDGWIIKLPYLREVYKLKPAHEMTTDLLYNGDRWVTSDNVVYDVKGEPSDGVGIYRLGWNDGWYVKDYRPYKGNANPNFVVDICDIFHKNPWVPKDLIELATSTSVYYTHTNIKLSDEMIKYLDIQKKITVEHLTGLHCKSLLDVGCGKGKMSELSETYLGVDVDPYNIVTARRRYKTKTFVVGDFNNIDWGSNSIFAKSFVKNKTKYDLILFNFTIHYSNNLERLIKQLTELINVGGYCYFSFLDFNKSFNLPNFIKKTGTNKFVINNPWLEGEPIIESWVSGTDLTNLMENNGWESILISNPIVKVNDKQFQLHNSIISRYMFKYT